MRKYDGEFPKRFSEEIFRYLSLDEKHFSEKTRSCFEQPEMDLEYFEHLTDRFRSPHLWIYENGQWRLRHEVR